MLIQYNKIRKIKTITATITSKIEQSKELTVKPKKSSTGFLLSEVQIGANEAKKKKKKFPGFLLYLFYYKKMNK